MSLETNLARVPTIPPQVPALAWAVTDQRGPSPRGQAYSLTPFGCTYYSGCQDDHSGCSIASPSLATFLETLATTAIGFKGQFPMDGEKETGWSSAAR